MVPKLGGMISFCDLWCELLMSSYCQGDEFSYLSWCIKKVGCRKFIILPTIIYLFQSHSHSHRGSSCAWSWNPWPLTFKRNGLGSFDCFNSTILWGKKMVDCSSLLVCASFLYQLYWENGTGILITCAGENSIHFPAIDPDFTTSACKRLDVAHFYNSLGKFLEIYWTVGGISFNQKGCSAAAIQELLIRMKNALIVQQILVV